MGLISNITSQIFGKTADIVDQLVVDKDLASKLKAKMHTQAAEFTHDLIAKEIDLRAQSLSAELIGSDAQRNWRPHLMYLIMAFLIWLIVVVPILGMFGIDIPVKSALDSVPKQMWNLLTIGVGGYITLRSGEKIAKSFTGK